MNLSFTRKAFQDNALIGVLKCYFPDGAIRLGGPGFH
jgi:hypothetical protein